MDKYSQKKEKPMAGNSQLSVVIGTGPLGMAVMEKLVSRGQQVRMVNRSGRATTPANVQVVKGDLTNQESAREVCRGATVVYGCINAPYTAWPEKFPPLVDGLLEGATAAGARLVYADNLYMYGPVAGEITERLPYAATGAKGRTRAELANRVLEAHKSGKLRATIGRAADFFGPRVTDSAMGDRVFPAALSGKSAQVLGNPEMPHTYTYIHDFAQGLVILGEREEALGEAWHVPSAETLTTRQFIELVYQEAGHPPKLSTAPFWLVSVLGLFIPVMRELKETYYEFNEPFIVDDSKFKATFGSQTTPHLTAIRQTLAWYRQKLAKQ